MDRPGRCSLGLVSYVKLNPSYYQMLQPESAWHPGAEGWSVAPYPGWGQNPALIGPKRLGVEGLGAFGDFVRTEITGLLVGAAAGTLATYLLMRK